MTIQKRNKILNRLALDYAWQSSYIGTPMPSETDTHAQRMARHFKAFDHALTLGVPRLRVELDRRRLEIRRATGLDVG